MVLHFPLSWGYQSMPQGCLDCIRHLLQVSSLPEPPQHLSYSYNEEDNVPSKTPCHPVGLGKDHLSSVSYLNPRPETLGFPLAPNTVCLSHKVYLQTLLHQQAANSLT